MPHVICGGQKPFCITEGCGRLQTLGSLPGRGPRPAEKLPSIWSPTPTPSPVPGAAGLACRREPAPGPAGGNLASCAVTPTAGPSRLSTYPVPFAPASTRVRSHCLSPLPLSLQPFLYIGHLSFLTLPRSCHPATPPLEPSLAPPLAPATSASSPAQCWWADVIG